MLKERGRVQLGEGYSGDYVVTQIACRISDSSDYMCGGDFFSEEHSLHKYVTTDTTLTCNHAVEVGLYHAPDALYKLDDVRAVHSKQLCACCGVTTVPSDQCDAQGCHNTRNFSEWTHLPQCEACEAQRAKRIPAKQTKSAQKNAAKKAVVKTKRTKAKQQEAARPTKRKGRHSKLRVAAKPTKGQARHAPECTDVDSASEVSLDAEPRRPAAGPKSRAPRKRAAPGPLILQSDSETHAASDATSTDASEADSVQLACRRNIRQRTEHVSTDAASGRHMLDVAVVPPVAEAAPPSTSVPPFTAAADAIPRDEDSEVDLADSLPKGHPETTPNGVYVCSLVSLGLHQAMPMVLQTVSGVLPTSCSWLSAVSCRQTCVMLRREPVELLQDGVCLLCSCDLLSNE